MSCAPDHAGSLAGGAPAAERGRLRGLGGAERRFGTVRGVARRGKVSGPVAGAGWRGVTDDQALSEKVDVAALVRACEERLNPSEEWKPFEGYPQSLSLCVLDAIWSINLRYAVTRGVIGRYRNERRWQANADEDDLSDLLALYSSLGGVDAFIERVATRNRVSTQPDAVRKGEAVLIAAEALHGLGIDSADEFRAADGTPLGDRAEAPWRAIPGQGSGISWRYLRIPAVRGVGETVSGSSQCLKGRMAWL